MLSECAVWNPVVSVLQCTTEDFACTQIEQVGHPPRHMQELDSPVKGMAASAWDEWSEKALSPPRTWGESCAAVGSKAGNSSVVTIA